MSGRTPPYFQIEWTNPVPLTTNFREYNIYARPAVSPAPPFVKLATYNAIALGVAPATVESTWTKFRDFMAGWGGEGSPWELGWQYKVTVVALNTRLESVIYGSTMVRDDLNPDTVHWFTSNEAPYLNCPANILDISSPENSEATTVYEGLSGRDYTFTRTRGERSGRRHSLTWYYHSLTELSEERVRWPRALAATGRTCALLVPRGDRILGTLMKVVPERTNDRGTTVVDVDAEFVETADWLPASYNLPPGFVLNGSSQYITTPSVSALNPGTTAFSLVQSGVFPSASGKVHASKGNIGTASSYGFRNPSTNAISFYVKGASAVVEATYTPGTSTLTPFSGREHTLVGTYDGAEARLWLDGTLVAASKGVAGAVTNSVALVWGANNGGASGFSAITPWHAGAEYARALNDREAVQACGWLNGWSGYKMPGAAEVFHDGRDDRCYSGTGTTMEDLSGNNRRGTITAAPPLVGKPWRLRELDTLVPAQ